jgi:hypothetical protein
MCQHLVPRSASPTARTRRPAPVRAWRAWLDAAGIEDGPAFRNLRNGRVTGGRLTGDGIARMVKRRPKTAGVDCRPWRMILSSGSEEPVMWARGPGPLTGAPKRRVAPIPV